MAKKLPSNLSEHQQEFVKLARANCGRQRIHEVFRDFCEMNALSISNAVDQHHYSEREERYLQLAAHYTKDEVERFGAMAARVVLGLEQQFGDFLGEVFMALDLGDNWKGQFFTPYQVSSLMARLTLGVDRQGIEQRGFLTVNEPACGSGGMVIAFAESLLEQGFNPADHMHAVVTDIDSTAVHMAYIQLSLCGVPAFVLHGNALQPGTVWSSWVTPVHILNGWSERLLNRDRIDALRSLLGPADAAHESTSHADQLPASDSCVIPSRADLVAHHAGGAQLSLFA